MICLQALHENNTFEFIFYMGFFEAVRLLSPLSGGVYCEALRASYLSERELKGLLSTCLFLLERFTLSMHISITLS